MCFVAVVVQSRLISFDRSLEEAAQDLGCPPFQAFMKVTLPVILPAVISGWMLAFTLSLDDLVIASLHLRAGRDDAADEDLQPGAPRRDARRSMPCVRS
jgi:putrescine transport system permease protein